MLLESLRLRDVLDRDQTRYRFTMDLMRRWVRHEHNVWAVLHRIEAGKRTGVQAPARRASADK